MEGSDCVARHFPFRIGRAPTANLRLDDSGIWDDHLTLSQAPDLNIEISVQPGALATLNGENVNRAALRSGDLIGIGAVQLRFALSPTRQKSLRARESLVWTALAMLCLFQVVLIYWLLGG